MNNPVTTISGYALLVGAIAALVHAFTAGGNINEAYAAVLAAIAGVSSIGAKDGGH